MPGFDIDKEMQHLMQKLKGIAEDAQKHGKHETLYAALSVLTSLEYTYNQEYTDPQVEQQIADLAVQPCSMGKLDEGKNTVLFYDAFGMDTRGLIQIYLKALVSLRYRIVFVTQAKTPEAQPNVMRILKDADKAVYHLLASTHTERLEMLRKIFAEEQFGYAFFYSVPWDITGAIAFSEIASKCVRYQINLTDHAFWIGTGCVDYSIEFRDYGASISHFERGFALEQLLELPYYPIINKDIAFQQFPSEIGDKKVIFSGGSLYKTLDAEGTFYQIVEDIITRHSDVAFLYAGSGDDREVRKLVKKYPSQVFFIQERSDLFEILRHSYLYLNTYPVSGALMLQYAAMASCIPVSLRRSWDEDAKGILLSEDSLGEMFTDKDALLQEIDRLLTDEDYKKEKQSLLVDMVISEELFTERLRSCIESPASPYTDGHLQKPDTVQYRLAFKEAVQKEELLRLLFSPESKSIHSYFLKEWLQYNIGRIKRKLVG